MKKDQQFLSCKVKVNNEGSAIFLLLKHLWIFFYIQLNRNLFSFKSIYLHWSCCRRRIIFSLVFTIPCTMYIQTNNGLMTFHVFNQVSKKKSFSHWVPCYYIFVLCTWWPTYWNSYWHNRQIFAVKTYYGWLNCSSTWCSQCTFVSDKIHTTTLVFQMLTCINKGLTIIYPNHFKKLSG